MSRGRVVVVAGPDGAGKSAVSEALATRVLPPPVTHLHHRPRVLPARTSHTGPVTEPHREPGYSRAVSAAKVVYVWLDYLAGYLLRVRPLLRRGGSVVLERGWWDLLVDPRRYRLAALPRLVRVLGLLLPRPDLTVVLDADPVLLAERKAELPAAEIARQLEVWRHLPAHGRIAAVDAGQPLGAVVAAVAGHLALPVRPPG